MDILGGRFDREERRITKLRTAGCELWAVKTSFCRGCDIVFYDVQPLFSFKSIEFIALNRYSCEDILDSLKKLDARSSQPEALSSKMEELTLTTPALLFSAISLIMLAYTNRFLAYAAVIRNLHDKYLDKMDQNLIQQIKNLKNRLNLTRYMQMLGISSLLLCVLTMFLIYVNYHVMAVWVFGVALLLLILSLALLIWEIQISVRALSYHISDIEEHLKRKKRFL